MTEKEFQGMMAELTSEITSLPASERAKLKRTSAAKSVKSLTEQAQSLRESVDFLRLSIKYILFDLEATHRENAVLRQLLEESLPEQDGD